MRRSVCDSRTSESEGGSGTVYILPQLGTLRLFAGRAAAADDARFAIRAVEAKLFLEHGRVGRDVHRRAARVADNMAPRVKVENLQASAANAVEMDHRLTNLDESGLCSSVVDRERQTTAA